MLQNKYPGISVQTYEKIQDCEIIDIDSDNVIAMLQLGRYLTAC